MIYIGIDYGEKRIGVAVSDESGAIAFPLETIENSDAAEAIASLAKEKGVKTIVLGESRDFQGNPNPVMRDIKALKEDLESCGLIVAYEAEFLTSALAARGGERVRPEVSRDRSEQREKSDAAAAALILQSYLDRIKNRPGVE